MFFSTWAKEPNIIKKLDSNLAEEVTSLLQHLKVVIKKKGGGKKILIFVPYNHTKLHMLNTYFY
jgi:hypothetical protein